MVINTNFGISSDEKSTKIKPALGNPNWVGKLEFHYYEEGSPQVRIIPFYENPRIQESQQPRLATYGPIGRAVSNFAYLGSQSRRFKVKFNITLPHLYVEDLGNVNTTRGLTQAQKRKHILDPASPWTAARMRDLAPALFFMPFSKGISGAVGASESTPPTGGKSAKYDSFYENPEIMDDMSRKFYNWSKIYSPLLRINSEGASQRRKIIDKITSMIASVRSSVVNNAIDPIYGPPIVRLSYGILYDNVPCVCQSYSIEFDPDAGFDNKTLLPRVLTLGVELSETRTFNSQGSAEAVRAFGRGPMGQDFMAGRDGLQGWEFIVSDEHEFDGMTMDPGGTF